MKYERPELDILQFQVNSDVITASTSDYIEDETNPGIIIPPGSF